MRSFLRGSLYGGVSATQSWMSPSPINNNNNNQTQAQATLPHHQHQQQRTAASSSLMAKSQYDSNAASFYRYNQQQPSYLAGANALQQSFSNNKTPATPANTPVDYFDGTNNNKQELTLEQLPESEYINGKFIMRGRVSKWFDQRGFGFIENGLGEHQQQFFVHARDLVTATGGHKTLYLGQAVEFEPEQTENGGHAMNVCALGGAPLQNTTVSAPTPASSSSSTSMEQQQQRPLPTYTTAVEAVVAQDHKPSIISPEIEEQGERVVKISPEDGEAHIINLPQPRFVGQVAHWTVDKGYGFIEVAGQEEHFFTHIKDFTCAKSNQSPAMPQAGDFVEFTPSYASNRKRATHVTLPNSVPFTPNAVVVAAPPPPQEPAKKKTNLSSLARAFALPEKKTVSSF